MKLAYFTNSILPSKQANVVHVLAMKQAFESALDDFILVTLTQKGYQKINNHLSLPLLKIPFYWWIYSTIASLQLKLKGYKTVYSRSYIGSYILSFFIPKFAIELHLDSWNKSKLSKRISRRIFSKAKSIVCITNALQEELLRFNNTLQHKTTVIPDAAFENLESTDFPVQGDNSKKKLAYVGSLSSGKGGEILMPLSYHLPANTELHIVTNLAKIDKEKFNQEVTYFYDFMEQKEVQRFLNSIDICLLPNQYSVKTGTRDYGRFTSPLKMFEYMAAGKPIVASDLAVLREVLNQSNAVLVDSEDVTAWAVGIQSVIQDDHLAQRLAERAKTDFIKNYTWELRVKKIINLLNE